MSIETVIENHLDVTVELREGHARIFTTIKFLRRGQSHIIVYDMSSTYREFLIVGPNGVYEVPSDDIIEYGVIKVVNVTDERGVVVDWTLEKVKRSQKTSSSSQNAHRDLHGPSKLLHKMKQKLGISN